MSGVQPKVGRKPGFIVRHLPILQWLPRYSKTWLTGDIIAGISVWALMVPQALGFAAISGVPVQYGLYAADDRDCLRRGKRHHRREGFEGPERRLPRLADVEPVDQLHWPVCRFGIRE